MGEDRPRDAELPELLQEVRRIQVQSSRLAGGVMAGGYRSVFRGAGVEFDAVREYEEGDDPRAIDWNVSARLGRPFIKKYVDERQLALVFVLDVSASMDGGFGVWSARQMAARVCACLALAAVRHGDQVGLIAFGRGVEKFVAPRKGIGHALRVVRDCLALPGGAAATDPAPALELAARALRRHSIVFLVSDFLSDGWGEALLPCARRHDTIAVRILHPELEAPWSGPMRLRDPEGGGGAVVDWRDPRVRAAYAERVAAWRRRSDAELRRARVDRMDVPIPRVRSRYAVARPILEFFRMRELRGAKR